ncbi:MULTISPECIES: phage virion morphogenesis protein [Citrobacter]|uniref:phage virion morphogenesis protein n=1 Tax=Citrobacter TaxID=544 RepID=UPI0019802FCD|nr:MULTISPECIES: phage virion morphogenesis protein [Citrobacter]MBN4811357.1 phage virion morphogenesis protein [Citrobacter braakii]MBN4816682.1 phage virion morphogenesis protein [Citrobacter braakii]MBN4826096.1 phage virion morphogenesis protein [Citrobacter braakii]MBN4840650.1 phage virion morphogenesis protein [Citrobacter braakii]MBN4854134.1 phage virion morphogenesis protein [Citrobacter braakii]
MSDFAPFEQRLEALIASLSPAGRRRLTVDIAKAMRQRQQQRIKSQTAPDGSAYTPRKRQPIKGKKGRIKREMFAKLRTSRYMKASGDDSSAAVEFTGKVQRIARVHQSGLKDKPGRDSPAVQYPERQLLGFSDDDQQLVESIIIRYLAG